MPVKLFGPSAYVLNSIIYLAGLDTDNLDNTVILKLDKHETNWQTFQTINGYSFGGFCHLTYSNDLQQFLLFGGLSIFTKETNTLSRFSREASSDIYRFT